MKFIKNHIFVIAQFLNVWLAKSFVSFFLPNVIQHLANKGFPTPYPTLFMKKFK